MNTENKYPLPHEGLLELCNLMIKTRNQAQVVKSDPELDNYWGDEIDLMQEKMNEMMCRVSEFIGMNLNERLEKLNENQ